MCVCVAGEGTRGSVRLSRKSARADYTSAPHIMSWVFKSPSLAVPTGVTYLVVEAGVCMLCLSITVFTYRKNNKFNFHVVAVSLRTRLD
jgi:hypothetical protein